MPYVRLRRLLISSNTAPSGYQHWCVTLSMTRANEKDRVATEAPSPQQARSPCDTTLQLDKLGLWEPGRASSTTQPSSHGKGLASLCRHPSRNAVVSKAGYLHKPS